MKRRPIPVLPMLRLLVMLLAVITSPQTENAAAEPVGENVTEGEHLFVRRIAPLLAEKCLACHGNDGTDLKGELDLRNRAGLLKGGESGAGVVVPGRPEESSLFLSVTRKHDSWSAMPPKEAEQLTATQVRWIRDWIAGGAVWPNATRTLEIQKAFADEWTVEDGVLVTTSGGLTEDWTNRRYRASGLWGYQPVRKPEVQQVGARAIDELIGRQFPTGLTPAPAADPQTFIRRASYDLTGLPPSPEEVEAFLLAFKSDEEAAVRQLIERLLESPHYGERMAQHWLDVVRYADSSGFANDYERGNAWRYRDYVVRSFNADKPFHQFAREQIAGDEMSPRDSESIIATGFLRMGPWELTGMEVAKVARQRFLDDVTNSVGETFLAHSLQCARCHDHKFDPVPTHDYYSIQAVFATTQLAEREAPFLPTENRSGFDERRYLEARQKELQQTLNRLDTRVTLDAGRKWLVDQGRDVAPWDNAVRELMNRDQGSKPVSVADVRKRLEQQKVSPDLIPPRHVGFSIEDYGNERISRKGLERLTWEFDRYQPYALAVYAGRTPVMKSVNRPLRMPDSRLTDGELEETSILTGGDPFSPGELVQPGVLSVLADVPHEPIPTEIEGRRLAFANWVAHPRNSLTTRAIVNRVWMWHFGEPIAGNPNNFGSTGKLPTHPELLDWLAATFVEQGWSIKELHRIIMLSAAYRRSGEHPDREQLTTLDPLGTSYAVFKPRRLTAEELRDSMLAVSGELNRELGGIPNRPEINLEAALQPRQVMGTFAAAWTPNPLPSQRHRRSLYSLKLRGLSDPALVVFNSPSPDFSCERRDVSTVTPQVFSLLNSQASASRVLALAVRCLKDAKEDRDALDRCFLFAYGRLPRESERTACQSHWNAMQQVHATTKLVMVQPPRMIRRDAVEENTGEKFSFDENLLANAEFVPDLQPSDCDPRTRALADVCLVLLNSNEFVYVY